MVRLLERHRAHLTKSQVRELWDAGSFLVQEYGILLNTRIVIAHERLGLAEVRDGAHLVSDLVHELGMALKRSAPKKCPRFHWLYVHNNGMNSGFSTTIVAYIPKELSDEADEWLFDHFLLNRFGSSPPRDAVRMKVTGYQNDAGRVHRHWQLMRILCRSVNPEIKVRDDGERDALIDVLSISKRLREGFSILEVPQRWRVSETVGEQAQRKATVERLAPLSAFGDRAWGALFAGWELREYQDRQREKGERSRARMKIELEWPEGVGQRQDQVRAALLERVQTSWPLDPKQRLRSWRGWWLPPAA